MLKTIYFPAYLFQAAMSSENGAPTALGPLIWIAFITIAFVLLRKNKMTKKASTILLIFSVIVVGVVFGATPSPVMPFFEITSGLTSDAPMPQRIQSIMGTVVILGLLLLSGYFVGRLFCGYACPLGALQELMSKLRFKTTAKPKRTPEQVKSTRKISYTVRWVVFFIYIIGVVTMGMAEFGRISNPFLGFQGIRTNNMELFLIPLILLLVVTITSIFVYRPYCRYFCPYGAVAAKLNKGDKFTIQLGNSCKACGLCERTCPTDSMDEGSDKSECYYCGRCIDICADNNIKGDIDLLDSYKIADINQHLTAAGLNPDQLDKTEFVDRMIKAIISTFPHSAKKVYFKELQAVLTKNQTFSIPHIQKIIDVLRVLAPEELNSIDFPKYNAWIETLTKEWVDQYDNSSEIVDVTNKIFYGTEIEKKSSKGDVN
jgi:ferredoxin-type protein NapH